MCIASVYVDDIIFIGTNLPLILALKDHLHNVFSIKDLGPLSYFLGLEVTRLPTGIILRQRKFTKELFAGYELDTSKPAAKTPRPLNLKLLADGAYYIDPSHFRCLVGKTKLSDTYQDRYLIYCTNP